MSSEDYTNSGGVNEVSEDIINLENDIQNEVEAEAEEEEEESEAEGESEVEEDEPEQIE